jgi:hypothetical protein
MYIDLSKACRSVAPLIALLKDVFVKLIAARIQVTFTNIFTTDLDFQLSTQTKKQ